MSSLTLPELIHNTVLLSVLAPLLGAFAAGVGGNLLGRRGAHSITIAGLAISFACSLLLMKLVFIDGAPTYNANVYTWMTSGHFSFSIGFLIDPLTVLMMAIVSCVSLLVHIYSIGYMHDDDGYQRFFSYMSLFTFSMLVLVSAQITHLANILLVM